MAFKKTLILLASLTATTFGAAVNGHEDCGSSAPSEDLIAAAREMQQQESVATKSGKMALAATINVPTYFHVIYTSKTKKDGYLTEAEVRKTLDDVNRGWSSMGVHFDFKGVDYSTNANWAKGEDEYGMKTSLRNGDYKTLNLFYIPVFKYNGQCHFPTDDSSKRAIDGCTMRTEVADNGQTTTHEIGHWFGLIHTFESYGGADCDAKNDMIDDTPAMINNWSCDTNDDSCPSLPGKDPVTNFMSYSTCRDRFTAGQKARAHSMYQQYRA